MWIMKLCICIVISNYNIILFSYMLEGWVYILINLLYYHIHLDRFIPLPKSVVWVFFVCFYGRHKLLLMVSACKSFAFLSFICISFTMFEWYILNCSLFYYSYFKCFYNYVFQKLKTIVTILRFNENKQFLKTYSIVFLVFIGCLNYKLLNCNYKSTFFLELTVTNINTVIEKSLCLS